MDAMTIRETAAAALAEQGAQIATRHPNDFQGDDATDHLTIRTPDGRVFRITIEESY